MLSVQHLLNKKRRESTRQSVKLAEVPRVEWKARPKMICTENSLECGKGCEDLQWNHCASSPPPCRDKKASQKEQYAGWKKVLYSWVVRWKTEPPESLSVLRKGTEALGQIRRVQFTSAPQRHANIRHNKGLSLGTIQVKSSHLRSPYALKFKNGSQEETERQEWCVRRDAWRLTKNIYMLKETDKTTFCSPANEWSLLTSSTIKSEKRDFVVDVDASIHTMSRKDLNSAEFGTVIVLKNPTVVVTANGEILTTEQTTFVCQRIGFIRDNSASRRYTSSLTHKTLRRSLENLSFDQWSKTRTHQKW